MLARSVFLWPGGPSVTLGAYLLGFKFFFAALFIAWAMVLLRRPSRACLLGGTLGLASFAWFALNFPLQRPYGVDDGLPGLFELAQPMVAASRVSSGEGWMVLQENPRAFWSLVVATLSGFDPAWLLELYPWLPLASLVFLALAVDWGLGGSAGVDVEHAGTGRALAVFFVLFLASDQLSVQQAGGPLWPRLFWLEPRLAFALGILVLHLRLLPSSRRSLDAVFSALGLALVFWLDPRLGGYAFAGGVVWLAIFSKRPDARPWPALSLTLGGALGLWWWSPSAWTLVHLPEDVGSWEFAARQWLSLTRHGGIVFVLGLLGLVRLSRGTHRGERLLAAQLVCAMVLWVASTVSSRAAAAVDFGLVDTYLRLLLAAVAGIEAHRLLIAFNHRALAARENLSLFPDWLRRHSPLAWGLALLIGLALPWSFPYWWHPVRFDTVYGKSLTPMSRQLIALSERIRAEVPRDAVFVAGQSYAAWIPALTGRQVLVVTYGPPPRDITARRRAESWFVESQDGSRIRAAAAEWRITHLAWGRLDAEADVAVDHRFFDGSPLFRKLWQQGRWIRVYELRAAGEGRRVSPAALN